MKLLQAMSFLKLVYGQRSLWCSIGFSFEVAGILLLMLSIMTMCGAILSAENMRPFLSLSPSKIILESEQWRYMVAQFSTLDDLFSVMHRLKYTLASLISFGMMFSFTIYLALLYLRKKGVRRCRVSSCVWTRRKVYWLQRGQSRTAYVLAAWDSSIEAKKCCREESSQIIEE